MKKTVYVASGLANWATVQVFQNSLRTAGLEIPHDWATMAQRELYESHFRVPDDLSAQEIRAASSVDCLVLMTPGGRGAHIEYGVALGARRPTVVLLDPTTRVIGFYREAAAIVTTADEALAAVLRLVGVSS